MKKLLYIICMCVVALSCERRELTYGYNPTCEVVFEADWSNMATAPTGMSIYCYPEGGGDPIIIKSNNINRASANLPAGVFNILVFNQIPTEYGGVGFVGLDKFETVEIKSIPTTSKWAVSKAGEELVRNPEIVAASTYLDFEVTKDDVHATIELKKNTKAEVPPLAVLTFKPKVVTKTTRVRIRLAGVYNHRSTRATLYGMASGYNFSTQQSHTVEVTHLLESWSLDTYDYSNGEIWTYFTSFGLPEFATSTRSQSEANYTRSEDAASLTRLYENWDGRLDLDILLVDNKTVVSRSIDLADKIVTSTSQKAPTKDNSDADADLDMDVNVDINIASGFGVLDDPTDDAPIVLPDVKPVGGSDSGFDATIDDWDAEEKHDITI